MFTLTVPGGEFWDEEKDRFVTVEDTVLELEHSLATLSKWEQKFRKPFIGTEKNQEELFSYIEIMIQTPDFPPDITSRITQQNINEIHEYLENPMSATWFNEVESETKSGESVTAEIVYYWMTAFQIPFECQYWPLNQLLTLIKVANLKNSKPKPMDKATAMARQRELNEQRRREYGSTG